MLPPYHGPTQSAEGLFFVKRLSMSDAQPIAEHLRTYMERTTVR